MDSDIVESRTARHAALEPTNPPSVRARRRLEQSVTAAITELAYDCEGLVDAHAGQLAPFEVMEALTACAEGVSLNLSRLEAGVTRPSYEDRACTCVLVARRLPETAWRDLQALGEQRFSELVLPSVLGTDTSFPALRALNGLRTVSMALDAGTLRADVRGLADVRQPLHVEIRCPDRSDIEVIAPPGITVSVECDGDILLGATATTTATAPAGAVVHRMRWSQVVAPAAETPAAKPRVPVLVRVWRFLSAPFQGEPAQAVTARDECFAELEDALAVSARDFRATLHDIRSQALVVLDCVGSDALDLARVSGIGSMLVLMRPQGWLALERYSTALHGHGIRRIRFPASLASLKHSEVLHTNLARLPELQSVHFGDAAARAKPVPKR